MKYVITGLLILFLNMLLWVVLYRYQSGLLSDKEIYVIVTKFLPPVFSSFISFLAAYLIFYKTKKKEDTNTILEQQNIKDLLVLSFRKKVGSLKNIEKEIKRFKEYDDSSLEEFFIKRTAGYSAFSSGITTNVDYVRVFQEDRFTDRVKPSDLEAVYEIYSDINILLIRTEFILKMTNKSEIPQLTRYINEYEDKLNAIEANLKNLSKV